MNLSIIRSLKSKSQVHALLWTCVLWQLACLTSGAIAEDDSPEKQELPNRSLEQHTEVVEQILATGLNSKEIGRLISIDAILAERASADASDLQEEILLALGRTGDPEALAYLRKVFEDDAERRDEAAHAMSLSTTAELADWRFMVRSLTVVEDQQAVSVLKALRRFRQRATKPLWLRRVLLLGLQLEENDRQYAVDLLEHWTGGRFHARETPSKSLAAFQEWFRKTYPSEPDPILPQEPPNRKWKYAEVLSKLALVTEGNATRGREVYRKAQCHQCHQKNELGEKFGPDLTTLGWRRQRKEVLQAILFPSHELDEEYATSMIATDSGKILTGLMMAGPNETVVVMQANGTKQTLSRSEIDKVRPARISIMPENLLETLSLQEIQELFAFLLSGDSGDRSRKPHQLD